MINLRKRMVKKANENPTLRTLLVPLLKRGAIDWSDANAYLQSIRGTIKVLNNALNTHNELKVLAESRLLLKWLSSILTVIGKDTAADAVNQATLKVR